ncbi:hypothetical protein XBI1_2860001 [Xenorhabdus bovienii str. Intermedium]|uniref:Uncharacterized protein n=1 Tax=Xenorhabdus bovienii str. Intermedium TaxID=1379677 RepID=A0A077QKD4_XENBV|nr:hypothetical protein XBI1_2860001 [Xenorhabdus bovienii str. Intermedium]
MTRGEFLSPLMITVNRTMQGNLNNITELKNLSYQEKIVTRMVNGCLIPPYYKKQK